MFITFAPEKAKFKNANNTTFFSKKNFKKVFLRDVWRERYLNKLKVWENENRQTSDLLAQNLKKDISAIKIKLERLTDAYLAEALELAEY